MMITCRMTAIIDRIVKTFSVTGRTQGMLKLVTNDVLRVRTSCLVCLVTLMPVAVLIVLVWVPEHETIRLLTRSVRVVLTT